MNTERISKRLTRVLTIALFIVCGAFPVWAQTNKAEITGSVTDAAGAAVPGATVTITKVDTGAERQVTTNDEGVYQAPLLDVGTYRVTVAAPNFQTTTQEDVILQTGDRLGLDLQLSVGGVGDNEVIITAETPLIQTESSERGSVITGREVTELPLSGRNFTQLATLTPGVARTPIGTLSDAQQFNNGDPRAGGQGPGGGNENGSTESARFARSGGAVISANGQRPTNNNFSLDGVDNNEPQFGTIGVFPNPDSIAEFKVTTSVPTAEVGRAGGAVIETIIKSGTNAFSGSLYYYGQNTALNAFHPILGRNRNEAILRGDANPPDKAVQQIHEFGFTFGGPIIKNRTFFFGDYLGQRNNLPAPFTTFVPTALSRIGNFTEFTPGSVLDPLTGQPFAGNIVPTNRLSPVASSFLGAYPLPTINVLNPRDNNPNFFAQRANRETIDNYQIKIDHRLTTNNQLTGSFNNQDLKRVRASYFDVVPAGFGNGDEFGDSRKLIVSNTTTFSPTILNSFRFGYTRINISILNAGVGGTQGISETFSDDVGIPNSNLGNFETSGSILTGGFGNGGVEFAGDGGPFIVRSQNPYFADTLTIVKGSQTIKIGGEARLRYLNTIDGGRSGGLKGNLAYGDNGPGTGANANCPAASRAADGSCFVDPNGVPYGGSGNAIANILLGVPALQAFRGSNPGGPFNLRSQEYGLFVQDDYKVTSNLTLNLGLRYDLFTPFSESDGRIGNFNLADGTVQMASGSGDRLIETDKNNFGPRAGFAYSFGPDRRMVIRGGYGLLYSTDATDYPPLIRNPPFTNSISFDPFNSASAGRSTFSLQTGPPTVPDVDPNNIPQQVNVYYVEPEQRIASINQYNLTYQYQFARDYSIDIGYVGNRSRNLIATRDIGGGGTAEARNPAGVFLSNAIAYENRASSQYDGMQVQLQKRLSQNFQGQISYTWSHTIDDSTGVFNGIGEGRGNRGGPANPFDFRRDRGNSALDVRHLLSANAIVDLPFGADQRFSSSNSFVNKLIGGFQANVIVLARSGFPFSVSGEDGISRASLIGDPFANIPAGRFLNPAAFATNRMNNGSPSSCTAAVGQTASFGNLLCTTNTAGNTIRFGNLGRNTFKGPAIYNTDLSIFKNTDIRENVRVQLGFEFFNIFNRTNFAVPNNNVDSVNTVNLGDGRTRPGGFGVFDSGLPGRVVQYRLKLLF